MAKTHPHIESPTREQLAQLVEGRPEAIAQTYLAMHELTIAALPDVRFSVDEMDASVGYAAHQYGYNGWGLAALTPYGKWVSLTLLQGALLDDPARLLDGASRMRHVKLKAPAEVDEHRDAIRSLLLAASRLHDA